MNVFQAQPQDVKKILPLYLAYREFYQVAPQPDAAEAFLTERLTLGQSTIFYVEHEGKPIAFAQLYPLFCSLEMKRIWLLYDLFVAPQHRQHGAAKLLLERAEQLAQETHSAFTMLSTATDNTQAQALYEGNGYVRDNAFYVYNRVTQ